MSVIGKAMGLARKTAVLLAAVLFLAEATATPHAQAAPLDITLQSSPDMMCDFIDVRYDATSQTLTATGFAEQVGGGNAEATTIVNGTVELTASISNAGEARGGSIVVKGGVPSAGIDEGTLLTGKLSSIGFGEKDGPLEFRFDTGGGSLGFNFGSQINVILSQSGFAGDFTRNFTSNSIAVAGIGW